MSRDARNRFWNAPAEDDFEDFFDEEFAPEFIDADSAFPEEMESDAEWGAIFDAGFSPEDVAREAFAEIADADDTEVNEFLFQMTEGMSPEELESFWRGLARFGRKALKVAAPVVRTVAPVVGTAIGGPIGGAVGGLLGQGVGALAGQLGSHGRSRRGRRRPSRRGRSVMTRRPARGRVRRARPRRRGRRRAGLASIGQQAGAILRNPQIQSILAGLIGGRSREVVGRSGETMSGPVAIAGLIEGLTEALSEAEAAGIDLDDFSADFEAEDFESAADAFALLVEMIGIDEDAGERAGPCPETGEAICRCNT